MPSYPRELRLGLVDYKGKMQLRERVTRLKGLLL